MKIYLDHNLIVYLRKNSNIQLEEAVDAMKERGDEFIFSPAHLEEIAVSSMRHGVDEVTIDKDITFLTELCGTNSLRPTTRNDVLYGSESPKTCYERVINQYKSNDYAESVEESIIRDANENPLGNPKEMNNKDPEEILSHITYTELLLLSLEQYNLTTHSESIEHLQNFPKLRLKNKFCLLEHSVYFAANLIEKLGYYRESTKKSRSRLHDVSHIIYGKYSDIFVTNDTKLLNKARAIYFFLDINTQVLTLEEFIKYEIAV
ncbi:hypothetical protein RI844_00090 [Thalassotalea fonticola]|uniref:DUF4935 domain-containing protein n=1 Tax=Thalassotalea fonticola TaxID=3065649 RepID=A0ABZ0GQN2_9GAMM|nr:hypothetical protein RI844_00090 [Colwelliaceae bacterium S1-1]